MGEADIRLRQMRERQQRDGVPRRCRCPFRPGDLMDLQRRAADRKGAFQRRPVADDERQAGAANFRRVERLDDDLRPHPAGVAHGQGNYR